MEWLKKIKNATLGTPVEVQEEEETVLKERRMAPRINCEFDAEIEDEHHKTCTGTLISLERTGLRCETSRGFEKGSLLNITIDEFSGILFAKKEQFSAKRIKARVVWCKEAKWGFTVGLTFADSEKNIADSWVCYVLAHFGISESCQTQQRRDLRIPLSIPVIWHRGDEEFHSGQVSDIGLGGLGLYIDEEPSLDSKLKLRIGPCGDLPAISCEGRVVRKGFIKGRDKFDIGIEFINLDPAQVPVLSEYVKTGLREIGE